MFKNQTSGGFDLEKLRINKYDRFKRLLFISCVAYSIMIFAGIKVHNHSHTLKKKLFPKSQTAFSIFTLIRKIIRHFSQKALKEIQRILQLE